ncbi:alpha/beta hydrolase [Acidisphaera sp. L21]|uniref:alpha/beta hydrolase n=1 Tax=Acidisphaera sp. L21 TaxID=1641851 RepID=UPI00131C9C29|nr:alpha/beta hydrolase [Acidisphaera sp. L21]
MASWQAHLTVLFLKWQVKRKIRGETDVFRARATMDRFKHRVSAGLAASEDSIGGIKGEWVRSVSGVKSGTLLYLHGGGYFACSPQTHRPITCAFAAAGLAVFAPEYRLAPEHPFPAAIDDAVAAYRGLLAQGIPARSIVVAGDSAGGGLALALLLSLRDAGDKLPAAAMLFSPWTDLAGTGDSLRVNHHRDAMFVGEGMERAASPYLAGTDPYHPLASPVYAELGDLPPLLVHVGSYEVLLDDSRRVVERAQQAGTDATMRTWPVVPHVWQLFRMPEAQHSMQLATAFLLQHLRT